MSTATTENPVEQLWQGFLATNPGPEHFGEIIPSSAMPRPFRNLALRHLLDNPTKDNLLVLINAPYCELVSSDHRAQAITRLLVTHRNELTGKELQVVLNKECGRKFGLLVAAITLERQLRDMALLRALICVLPKGCATQTQLAEIATDLSSAMSTGEQVDILGAICHFASAELKQRAIELLLAKPTRAGLIEVINQGTEEQREQAGRIYIRQVAKSAGEILFVLLNVKALNDEAWALFQEKQPSPEEYAKAAVGAINPQIKEDAWMKVKASQAKGAFREVVLSRTEFAHGEEAARLLMAHPEYDRKDAGLIESCIPSLREEAMSALLKSTPESYIKAMEHFSST